MFTWEEAGLLRQMLLVLIVVGSVVVLAAAVWLAFRLWS